jgi:hypothetical protein
MAEAVLLPLAVLERLSPGTMLSVALLAKCTTAGEVFRATDS